MTTTIDAAALHTVGKHIGDCTEADLDRIIAAATAREAAARLDLATARTVKARRTAGGDTR